WTGAIPQKARFGCSPERRLPDLPQYVPASHFWVTLRDICLPCATALRSTLCSALSGSATPRHHADAAAAVAPKVSFKARCSSSRSLASAPILLEYVIVGMCRTSNAKSFVDCASTVAVGMPVSQHPPHRSPRAALPHEAPISDEWRQNELGDTDEEYAATESTGQPVCSSAPKLGCASHPDGSTCSSRVGSPESEMSPDCQCFPVPRGS